MIYLNPPYAQVQPRKLKKYMTLEHVNTGEEHIADDNFFEAQWWKEKRGRRGRERRQRSLKPLLDLRTTRDRRHCPDKPSINIEV